MHKKKAEFWQEVFEQKKKCLKVSPSSVASLSQSLSFSRSLHRSLEAAKFSSQSTCETTEGKKAVKK